MICRISTLRLYMDALSVLIWHGKERIYKILSVLDNQNIISSPSWMFGGFAFIPSGIEGIRMKIFPNWFYKSAEISIPYNISHRHIRITKGERWIKLFRVKDLMELRGYLIRFAPDKVYISVSCYLEPELVSLKWRTNKAGYKYLPNIILSSDFVMDFDDGVTSLQQMLKAYKYLKELGYAEFMAIQTKRGFHLWILDWFNKECKENLPHKPFCRELFIIRKKKELCAKLESQAIKFDKPISIDTRRVIKLWGSLTDDNFICVAYNDPIQLAKEFIQGKEYLQHHSEAERGLIADLAQ